ncbi:MAG: hypothetical protein KC462_05500 [Cyanobacteria bacterium HKST-UBA05]|nr:hypothetical protein [Cyanobacteria bacterium HKST-UBA05]
MVSPLTHVSMTSFAGVYRRQPDNTDKNTRGFVHNRTNYYAVDDHLGNLATEVGQIQQRAREIRRQQSESAGNTWQGERYARLAELAV